MGGRGNSETGIRQFRSRGSTLVAAEDMEKLRHRVAAFNADRHAARTA